MNRIGKGILVMLIVLLSIGVYGCTKKEASNKDLFTSLKGIDNYTTQNQITLYKDGKSHSLTFEEVYEGPLKYKVTVLAPKNIAGNITIAREDGIIQYNKTLNQKVTSPISKEENPLLFGTFMQGYLKAQNPTELCKMEGDKLTATLTNPNSRYGHTQKVWFNAKSLEPEKMELMGEDGQLTAQIIYKEFQYNVEIKQGVYELK